MAGACSRCVAYSCCFRAGFFHRKPPWLCRLLTFGEQYLPTQFLATFPRERPGAPTHRHFPGRLRSICLCVQHSHSDGLGGGRRRDFLAQV